MSESGDRPFHETIVELIGAVPVAMLRWVAGHIKGTKIPKNHDAIAEAWKQRLDKEILADAPFGVLPVLEQKKREAEEGERLNADEILR